MGNICWNYNLSPSMVTFMKEDKKKIYSWAFYDWANSAYSTTVMAGFFPIFFEKFYSNPNDVIQKLKGSTENFHIYTFGGLKETNKWLTENNYA